MGDKVEPGREFIEKHASRAENLLFPNRDLVCDIKAVICDITLGQLRHKGCHAEIRTPVSALNDS